MHNCQLSPNQPRRAHHLHVRELQRALQLVPGKKTSLIGVLEASDDVLHPRDVSKIYLQVLESSEVKSGKTYLTPSTLQLPFKGKRLATSPHTVTTYCCAPDTLKEQDRMQPDEEQTPICESKLSLQILRNTVCVF